LIKEIRRRKRESVGVMEARRGESGGRQKRKGRAEKDFYKC